MKMFKQFALILLCCFAYLINNAQVNSAVFLSSAYDYSSGLVGFHSVATQASNTNAAFANPALMTNNLVNIGFNQGRFSFAEFDYKSQYVDFVANQSFDQHAFGTYLKVAQHNDFILNTDTFTAKSNYMTGLAYAYQFNKKWSIGTNLNYYVGRFKDVEAAKRLSGEENYQGLTFSLGGLYEDEYEIDGQSSINWSVGANINNLGAKNAAIPSQKDKEFIWTQAGLGTSLGYKRQSLSHPFSIHTTLMYQVNNVLIPHYRDENNDSIPDRETMSAVEGLWSGIREISWYNLDIYVGLEVQVLLENDWQFGFRTSFAHRMTFGNDLYTSIFVGYNNFYFSVGNDFQTRQFIRTFGINRIGFSLGYQVPI